MRRYYSHRITKRERAAVDTLYAPRRFRENERNAFSHSQQCDQFFSAISKEPGGVAHQSCRCWCHGATNLHASAEPEYDFTPPPEYANSADLAFANVVTTGKEFAAYSEKSYLDTLVEPPPFELFETFAPEYESDSGYTSQLNADQFPNRSRRELSLNKCDTCGDKLADCECVE